MQCDYVLALNLVREGVWKGLPELHDDRRLPDQIGQIADMEDSGAIAHSNTFYVVTSLVSCVRLLCAEPTL